MIKKLLEQKERQVKMKERFEKEIIFQNDEKNLSPLGETVPTNKSMHVTKKNVLWTFFRQDGQSDREGIPYNENDVLEPSPVCKQTSSPRRGRLKAAFTLAEVMIALVILGVIATITVPSLMRKATESSNRTKVKKSIADFEKVVENMRITQGLKSVGAKGSTDQTTLVGWANNDGKCTNGKTYFKINNEYSTTTPNCKFQTNDGVWWDIEDMSQPKISIDKDGSCLSSVGAAEGETCYNKSFYLTVSDGGTDKGNAFIVNAPDGDACETLKFAKILGDDVSCEPDYSKACEVTNINSGFNCTNCFACTVYDESLPVYIYDKNGKNIKANLDCETQNIDTCKDSRDSESGLWYMNCSGGHINEIGQNCDLIYINPPGTDCNLMTMTKVLKNCKNGTEGCSIYQNYETGIGYWNCDDAIKGEGCSLCCNETTCRNTEEECTQMWKDNQ